MKQFRLIIMRIIAVFFAFAMCIGCEKDAEVKIYTVVFNTNDGSSIESVEVISGQCADEPTNPTKTGYSFAGWYSDSALTLEWDFTSVVTENIILYAKWGIDVYTVTFVSNEGSSVDSQYIDYNSTASVPTDPTLTGYTFAGWYYDSDLTTAYDFSAAITEDVTLYAKWEINVYSVSFNSNDGSEVEAQNIDYNSTASEPTTPTLTGYTFAGWYSDSAFTTVYDFATAITEDITLYAKWSINIYTITFASNGGSDVTTQYIDYNTTASEPTTPTLTGYTFNGWYSDSSLTTAYSFATAVTADITLYAKWTINVYTATFESNEGSSVSQVSADYNTTFSEPTAPTRTGYTFAGWYTDSSLTTEYSFATAVTTDITLYAKWISVGSGLGDMGTGSAW